jgi:hypothetical protein
MKELKEWNVITIVFAKKEGAEASLDKINELYRWKSHILY